MSSIRSYGLSIPGFVPGILVRNNIYAGLGLNGEEREAARARETERASERAGERDKEDLGLYAGSWDSGLEVGRMDETSVALHPNPSLPHPGPHPSRHASSLAQLSVRGGRVRGGGGGGGLCGTVSADRALKVSFQDCV